MKDLGYKFEPMIEEVPYQWAQALHLVTRLTSKYCGQIDKLSCRHMCKWVGGVPGG